ncbi:MAG TPA: hypothetical protein VEZ70_07975 [Allosphingosinicella sp.]|nr:hypothetical protein [Allosphingosinicella sp.]
MRKALAALLLLSAAACGGSDTTQESSQDLKTFNVDEQPSADVSGRAARPPGISPTAAPGVAFDYRYAFRLPPARIGAVQEQHASACEKLGPDRCRITGMVYEQDGEDEVSAQLLLRLDPQLARRFGREASDAVTRAEGLIASVQISGEDVGSAIESDQQNQAQVQENLRRIERELAARGRSGTERAELQRQAEELRRSQRINEQTIGERRKQLATTPMTFRYEAGQTDRSFAGDMARALDAFGSGARVLLIALLYILPWMLAALALVLGGRWVNRRYLGGRPDATDAATPPTAE